MLGSPHDGGAHTHLSRETIMLGRFVMLVAVGIARRACSPSKTMNHSLGVVVVILALNIATLTALAQARPIRPG